ncbi:hypothetical protein D3C71_1346150 [compost metagenome]
MNGALLALGAREEQDVLDHPPHALIRWHSRLDHRTVFVRTAGTVQRDLRDHQEAVDGSAQIVRNVGRHTRQAGEGILQPVEHVVERPGHGFQLGNVVLGGQPFVQGMGADAVGRVCQAVGRGQDELGGAPCEEARGQRADTQRDGKHTP